MIDGISRVQSRISEIAGRIDEISKIGQEKRIEPIPADTVSDGKDAVSGEKSFSDILKEVQSENGSLPGLENTGKTSVNAVVGAKGDSKKLLELLYQQMKMEPVKDGDVDESISDASSTTGVDSDLIRAVISQESEFNPAAVSNTGAMGLMQLMPETAQQLGVSNPFDVKQNVNGGSKYLKDMLQRYGGDLNRALAAYNAGPAAVDRYNGVPPYAETQDYVRQVLRKYNDLKNYKTENQ
jgi:hypothetical protein